MNVNKNPTLTRGEWLYDMHGLNIGCVKELNLLIGYRVYYTSYFATKLAYPFVKSLLEDTGKDPNNKMLYIVHLLYAGDHVDEVVAAYHYDGDYVGIVAFRREE